MGYESKLYVVDKHNWKGCDGRWGEGSGVRVGGRGGAVPDLVQRPQGPVLHIRGSWYQELREGG